MYEVLYVVTFQGISVPVIDDDDEINVDDDEDFKPLFSNDKKNPFESVRLLVL